MGQLVERPTHKSAGCRIIPAQAHQIRDIAQLGSAFALGAKGRRLKRISRSGGTGNTQEI